MGDGDAVLFCPAVRLNLQVKLMLCAAAEESSEIWSEGEGRLSELGQMISEWCLGTSQFGCADLCL